MYTKCPKSPGKLKKCILQVSTLLKLINIKINKHFLNNTYPFWDL